MSALNRAVSWADRAVVALASVLLAAIAVVINIQVFYRYVLRAPLVWTTELASYMLVYTVLLGAGVALRRRVFARVEFATKPLPARARLILEIGGYVCIVVFLVVATWATTDLVRQAAITQIVSPALGIPVKFIYGGLQAGFVIQIFFAISALVAMAQSLAAARKGPSATAASAKGAPSGSGGAPAAGRAAEVRS